jgi:hypothetical protein
MRSPAQKPFRVGQLKSPFGLAGSKALSGSPVLRFAPSFPPNWNEVRIKNIRVGESVFDLHYERNLGGITLTVERARGPALTMEFAPQLEAGAEAAETARLSLKTGKNEKKQIPVFEGIWIELPHEPLQIGQRAQQLRILSERLEEDRFVLVCEGAGGRTYDLILHSPWDVTSISGGQLLPAEKAEVIRLEFADTPGEYARREVVVNLEK